MTYLYSSKRRFRYDPESHSFEEAAGRFGNAWVVHEPVPKHWSPPKVKKPERRPVKFPDQMPDFIAIP